MDFVALLQNQFEVTRYEYCEKPRSFMHLSGPSRAIKFLYAPATLPPQYGPWNLPRGLFTSLVYLWLTYVYAVRPAQPRRMIDANWV